MNENKLTKKNFLVIFLLFGFIFTTLIIVALEITWDEVCKALNIEKTLKRELIECFTKAAILEETFKFLGFFLARKKYKISRVVDSMFAAGLVGLMYGLVEKAVYFNPMALIINIFFPMHLLWQLNQGRHFQISLDEKKNGNKGKAIKHMLLATVVIVLFHGIWDALLAIGAYMIDEDNAVQNGGLYGGLILGFTLLFGLIYTVVTIIITVKTAKKAKRESQTDDIETKAD